MLGALLQESPLAFCVVVYVLCMTCRLIEQVTRTPVGNFRLAHAQYLQR